MGGDVPREDHELRVLVDDLYGRVEGSDQPVRGVASVAAARRGRPGLGPPSACPECTTGINRMLTKPGMGTPYM